MLGILSSIAQESKDFLKHLNPVMLVFIGLLSLSTLRWAPKYRVSVIFLLFFHHFVLAKLATSSIKVKVHKKPTWLWWKEAIKYKGFYMAGRLFQFYWLKKIAGLCYLNQSPLPAMGTDVNLDRRMWCRSDMELNHVLYLEPLHGCVRESGSDISTSPLAPASEFLKKWLSGKYILVSKWERK